MIYEPEVVRLLNGWVFRCFYTLFEQGAFLRSRNDLQRLVECAGIALEGVEDRMVIPELSIGLMSHASTCLSAHPPERLRIPSRGERIHASGRIPLRSGNKIHSGFVQVFGSDRKGFLTDPPFESRMPDIWV